MIKAKRSLRIARVYTANALKRLKRLPDMLIDAFEKHALRH